ncbi:MAG: rRNA maturation RNase YbeY [Oscillospiraceae bacterium]|jgi:probable rRNA maturation factor|nr:rRNA maturation RNase YbeY [Oscillospiraceae bacterium]
MSHKIAVSRDKRGLGVSEAGRLIGKAARAALRAEHIAVSCEIGVLLTDDAGIRARNLAYRNIDRATDVLSFPLNEFSPGGFDPENAETDPGTGRVLLGDIALSLERAAAQGAEFGHGIRREIQYLAVHSVLHLLGYDHLDEGAMKGRMRAREKAVMARLGGTEEK